MNTTQSTNRIHPMVAVAAASVTLASLLGIAALTGILPSSHGSAVNTPSLASQNLYASSPAPIAVQANGTSATTHKTVVRHVPNNSANHAPQPTGQVAQGEAPQQPSPAPAPAPAPAPVQQKQAAAPHNSPIGIGVGAVIGGLLGNQVGSGDGKTLATIAGAVGGGYVGNEVAKRNQ
jgi:uncharacterized protein YcfJ